MFERNTDQLTRCDIRNVSTDRKVSTEEIAEANQAVYDEWDRKIKASAESRAERIERENKALEAAQVALDRLQRRTLWQRIRAFLMGDQSC